MEITSPKHTYEVSYLAGETDAYRLYVCVQNDTGRECLLQVAKERKHNAGSELLLNRFKC